MDKQKEMPVSVKCTCVQGASTFVKCNLCKASEDLCDALERITYEIEFIFIGNPIWSFLKANAKEAIRKAREGE